MFDLLKSLTNKIDIVNSGTGISIKISIYTDDHI